MVRDFQNLLTTCGKALKVFRYHRIKFFSLWISGVSGRYIKFTATWYTYILTWMFTGRWPDVRVPYFLTYIMIRTLNSGNTILLTWWWNYIINVTVFTGRPFRPGLTSWQKQYTLGFVTFVDMGPRVRRRLRSKAMDGAASRSLKLKTMNWDELEDWQKDNEYILRGYRRWVL